MRSKIHTDSKNAILFDLRRKIAKLSRKTVTVTELWRHQAPAWTLGRLELTLVVNTCFYLRLKLCSPTLTVKTISSYENDMAVTHHHCGVVFVTRSTLKVGRCKVAWTVTESNGYRGWNNDVTKQAQQNAGFRKNIRKQESSVSSTVYSFTLTDITCTPVRVYTRTNCMNKVFTASGHPSVCNTRVYLA